MLTKKRKRVQAQDAQHMLGLDADHLIGTDKSLERSATYEIETIGGNMRAYIGAAMVSETEMPVIGCCDEYNSILIMNKLYGQQTIIPVRNRPDAPESIHLFSAFHPRVHRTRLDGHNFIYEPLYGGVTDCGPDPTDANERVYAPRPAAMCRLTQDLQFFGGRDFGWRALMYVNKGADDPYPTGIVALEGWLFTIVDAEVIDESTGKLVHTKDAVDIIDMDEYVRRIQIILDRSADIVRSRETPRGAAPPRPPAALSMEPEVERAGVGGAEPPADPPGEGSCMEDID